jgi:DNA-binding transcriptional ArsR family regulator
VNANRDADLWGALADGTRLAIVARLADGPLAVGKLAAGLPVNRSAVSQHLKILKDADLVEDVAAGTRRIYRLNPVALGRCGISSTPTGSGRWPGTPMPWKRRMRRIDGPDGGSDSPQADRG